VLRVGGAAEELLQACLIGPHAFARSDDLGLRCLALGVKRTAVCRVQARLRRVPVRASLRNLPEQCVAIRSGSTRVECVQLGLGIHNVRLRFLYSR
jgi:hypothetical protein